MDGVAEALKPTIPRDGRYMMHHHKMSNTRSKASISQEQLLVDPEIHGLIIRDSPSALVIATEERRIVFANPACYEMLGYFQGELLEKSTLDITHPDDQNISDGAVKKLLNGEVNNICYEKRYLRKNGTAVWVQMSLSLLRTSRRFSAYFIGQCIDISENKARENMLFEEKELAQVTLNSIADGVIRTNAEGTITLCNKAALQVLHEQEESIVGKKFNEIVSVTTQVEDPTFKEKRYIKKIPNLHYIRVNKKKTLPAFLSMSSIRNMDQEIVGNVLVFQDARGIVSLSEELAIQATHDHLTGLPNRLALESEVKKILKTLDFEKNGKRYFALYIDLDRFKKINDSCGHLAGDRLLKNISLILLKLAEPQDFFSRIGGDEFLLITSGMGIDEINVKAEKILAAIRLYKFHYEGGIYSVGASIGITEFFQFKSMQDIFFESDSACYIAKKTGRSNFKYFNPNNNVILEYKNDLHWRERVTSALYDFESKQKDEFELFFQPIVDAHKSIVGSEALIRLRSVNGDVIPPHDFLPTAARMGMMPSIDRWVLMNAISIIKKLRDKDILKDVLGEFVAVNISADSVASSYFRDTFLAYISSCPDGLHRIRIEITETEHGSWGEDEISFLRLLRDKGVQIILDDFGVAYNSFGLLKRLPLDGIKLDRIFISNLGDDVINYNLVVAIVNIANNLGLSVVAEGIEDEATFDDLKKIGLKMFQGFVFQEPRPLRM
ncbi:sensor domain-containing protein [Robbsia andropogonis]|uniref:sensor domain-containing protein n=2 Tax=Robbsia andropogonis TaxID=28092 RepID=UPI0004BAC45D|nr:EAL domain-containing protein [Robbsia andropogonis]MCP1118570.1 EAL domain-containing protein [Robbsia andropogonis]MCP1128037.1 EAL domain-containing protein [Robbsia andropogonis]